MCEITKSQRRTYRDQDPPRIVETARACSSLGESEQASGNDAISNADPNFCRKEHHQSQQQQQQQQQHSSRKEPASISDEAETMLRRDSASSPGWDNTSAGALAETSSEYLRVDNSNIQESASITQVPYTSVSCLGKSCKEQVITNGVKRQEDSCGVLTNGREMAPAMGVPPPPPPAPHMGPDGLILPKKLYNPCLISNNHKDLRRELLFNQKIGRNVLNQKTELQRALEKKRETAMRKEAERNRDETYKDDPRTALQRALEQRAKHIQLTEQPQIVEPPNPLVTARAKLRTRTDSQ